MIEIYFGLTDKHVQNFEIIIQNQKKDNEKAHKILITDKHNFKQKFWDKVIISDAVFLKKGTHVFIDLYYMIKKIKAYKNIINQLKVYKKEKQVRIYLAYVEDVLSNYLFFSFHSNAEILIVEDGVLNYYNHSFKNISPKRFYIKKFLSQLFGIQFLKYQGHSSGIEYDRAVCQYLSFPEMAYWPKKAKQMPVEVFNLKALKNDLFIIGQENLTQIVGLQSYKTIFYEFVDDLKQNMSNFNIQHIYYKPRHKCLDFELKYMQEVFKDFNLKILNNEYLAEEDYFKNIQSAHIASMVSSALLIIYAKAGKDMKPQLRVMYKPVIQNDISRLFEKLEFIKLGQ
jgi:hypothetical protein